MLHYCSFSPGASAVPKLGPAVGVVICLLVDYEVLLQSMLSTCVSQAFANLFVR